jgi:hypothetical protein
MAKGAMADTSQSGMTMAETHIKVFIKGPLAQSAK